MSLEREPQHLISAKQISVGVLKNIFTITEALDQDQQAFEDARQDIKERYRDDAMGIAMTFEPSSRTRWSFIRAAESLNVKMLSEPNPKESSSVQKGESLEDTIMTLNETGYNAIVMRSDKPGAAEIAASVSDVTVINAGDGDGQHPTQAIADAKTITDDFGFQTGLVIAHIGDPWNSRTVHSQVDIMRPFNPTHIFSAIPELSGDNSYRDWLEAEGINFIELKDVREAISEADVIDVSRFQAARQLQEKDESDSDYEARLDLIKHSYIGATILHDERMEIVEANPQARILHPLPRNEEIPAHITYHPQGRWREQMRNGMLTRRAILYLALTEQLFAKEVSIPLSNRIF